MEEGDGAYLSLKKRSQSSCGLCCLAAAGAAFCEEDGPKASKVTGCAGLVPKPCAPDPKPCAGLL